MKGRSCLLLAVLLTLLAPAQSYGYADPALPQGSASGSVLALQAEREEPGEPSVDSCALGFDVTAQATTGGVVESPICFAQDSLGDLIREFHRAEVRRRERKRRERLARIRAREARQPHYISESEVRPPRVAPRKVKEAIEAANEIATTPYIWGGGHGSFESEGYDCSGAVSYALHGGGFLESPLDSTGLETWGEPGPGRWITVYANSGHAWMVVTGIAFDTVGGPGPRWHDPWVDSPEGFEVRHPPGY